LEQQKEWEHKEKVENLSIDFAKQSGELYLWIQGANEVLTEVIAVNSVEGVKELQEEFENLSAQKGAKHSSVESLRHLNGELEAQGVTQNPLSELTFDDIETKWASISQLFESRNAELDAEAQTQSHNESLRVKFAEHAHSLDKYLTNALAAVAEQSTSDDLEAQLEGLQHKLEERSQHHGKIDELSALNQELVAAKIVTNKHTSLTNKDIQVKWDTLLNNIQKKQKVIENEVLSKKHSDVTADQLNELKECFAHFDKSSNNSLLPHEFKACLSSLGESLSEQQMDVVIKEYGDAEGKITFQKFTDFMAKRLTDTDNKEQILASFKCLAGDKNFITEQELKIAFPDADQRDYLLANLPPLEGGYDYSSFTADIFTR